MDLKVQVKSMISDISKLSKTLTTLTTERLENEIVNGIQEYLDCESESGSLLVLSRFKTGMYANYLKANCTLNEKKFGKWSESKKKLEDRLGNKKTVLYECMKLAQFHDAKNYSDLGFSKIMKGIGNLYKYIDLSGFQESDDDLRITGTYNIENIIKSYKPESNDVKAEFDAIIKDPRDMYKSAIINIAKEKGKNNVVDLLNKRGLKISYKQAKEIKEHLNLPNVSDDNIISIISFYETGVESKKSRQLNALLTVISTQQKIIISKLEECEISKTAIGAVVEGFKNIKEAIEVQEDDTTKNVEQNNASQLNPYENMSNGTDSQDPAA